MILCISAVPVVIEENVYKQSDWQRIDLQNYKHLMQLNLKKKKNEWKT